MGPVASVRLALLAPLLVSLACSAGGQPGVVVVCAQEAGLVEVHAADSLATLATIPLGEGAMPHNVTFTPDGSRALVTVMRPEGVQDELVVIDMASLRITGRVALEADAAVAHVVVSPDGTRAYVSGWIADRIFVVDLATLTRLPDLELGGPHHPHGMRLSADGQQLFTANSDSSVSRIEITSGVVHDYVLPGPAVQVAVGQTAVYASVTLPAAVARIDLATEAVAIWPLPQGTADLAQVVLSADQRDLLVAEQGDAAHPGDRVLIVDVTSGELAGEIEVGQGTHGLAVASDGTLWVTGRFDRTLSRVDVAAAQVTAQVETGRGPNGVAVSPPSATAR